MAKGIGAKAIDFVKDRVKRHYIKRHGLEALSLLNEVSRETGRPLWLYYGTLLGAYREHGFIKHDVDIDVSMYASDFDASFERALYDRGFKILRFFRRVDATHPEDRRTTELTLKFKHVQIDVFLQFQEQGRTFCYLWTDDDKPRNVWKGRLDFFEPSGFKEIDFLGVRAFVPEKTREFLEDKYGQDFMTPMPGWQPKKKSYLPTGECYGEVIGGWI